MWQRLRPCFFVPHARLGWLLVVIGVITWQLFGRHADWKSLHFLGVATHQVDGVVVSITPTGYTVGDELHGTPIYAVRFTYKDLGNVRHRAISWSEKQTGPPGTKVQIEIAESDSSIARISGYRSGMLPLWAGLVLLFPIFGALCISKVFFAMTDDSPSDGESTDPLDCKSGQQTNAGTHAAV